MKRALIFLGIFSVALDSASATEYIERSGGFSYDLPDDWTLREGPGVKYKMAFGKQSEGAPGNISLTLVDSRDGLPQAVSAGIKELSSGFAGLGMTNFKVLNISAFETAGKQIGVQAVTQVDRADGKTIRQILYYFERKDGKKLVVTCSVTDVGTTYDAVFDNIMKSFKVTL